MVSVPRFFKDRHWLFTEFPELKGQSLAEDGAAGDEKFTIFEVSSLSIHLEPDHVYVSPSHRLAAVLATLCFLYCKPMCMLFYQTGPRKLLW